MNHLRQLTVTFLLLAIFSCPSLMAKETPEATILSSFVVQDQGRLKPVDTFARNHLLSVHQASKISSEKLSASQWLFDLLFHGEKSFDKKHYKIREPEVLEALGIKPKLDHLYSFRELRTGVNSIRSDLQKWFQLEKEQRSLVQTQVMRLYQVLGTYYQISRSLSLFEEDLSIENEALAKGFDLEPNQKVSYLHFHERSSLLRDEVTKLSNTEKEARGDREKALLRLVSLLSQRIQDQVSTHLAIIPSDPSVGEETWSAPWALMGRHDLSPWTWERLHELQGFYSAMSLGKVDKANSFAETFKKAVAHRHNIDKELKYNRVDRFMYSMVMYLISFTTLLLGWLIWNKEKKWVLILSKVIAWASLASMIIGLGLHTDGIVSRMIIMNRPPVSTLYESIIFVGFICVLLCLILELVRRNGVGLFCGTTLGVTLHFLGFSYADDGDTMGMLVAVLDSNFWLATHVVTITMGYGITVVAGLIGHLYLFMAIIKPKNKSALQEIYKNAIGLSLVALLFTTLGTILGGIWADQSWGRFWGWDPKENGAMLIVLWLLMLLHGRISGQMKALSFSAGLVIANIIVALAWFGVNLLQVGLHSYGFTDSIAYNLLAFTVAEVMFALVGYVWARKRLMVI